MSKKEKIMIKGTKSGSMSSIYQPINNHQEFYLILLHIFSMNSCDD